MIVVIHAVIASVMDAAAKIVATASVERATAASSAIEIYVARYCLVSIKNAVYSVFFGIYLVSQLDWHYPLLFLHC